MESYNVQCDPSDDGQEDDAYSFCDCCLKPAVFYEGSDMKLE